MVLSITDHHVLRLKDYVSRRLYQHKQHSKQEQDKLEVSHLFSNGPFYENCLSDVSLLNRRQFSIRTRKFVERYKNCSFTSDSVNLVHGPHSVFKTRLIRYDLVLPRKKFSSFYYMNSQLFLQKNMSEGSSFKTYF